MLITVLFPQASCGIGGSHRSAAIFAFDANDGHLVWQTIIPNIDLFVSRKFGAFSRELAPIPPTITPDTVTFHAIAPIDDCAGEEIDLIVDRVSGAVIRREPRSTGGGGTRPITTAEAVSGSLRVEVNAGAQPPYIRASDESTAVRWQTLLPSPFASALKDDDGPSVVVATDGTSVYLAVATYHSSSCGGGD